MNVLVEWLKENGALQKNVIPQDYVLHKIVRWSVSIVQMDAKAMNVDYVPPMKALNVSKEIQIQVKMMKSTGMTHVVFREN